MPFAALADWFPFLAYAFFALAIPASLIAFSFLLATRPTRRTRAQVLPFESGVSAGPPPRQRFAISFYLTALLFIVFDIEIVFLFPVAVVLREVGAFALAALGFYLFVLVIALVYDWKKGGLEWR